MVVDRVPKIAKNHSEGEVYDWKFEMQVDTFDKQMRCGMNGVRSAGAVALTAFTVTDIVKNWDMYTTPGRVIVGAIALVSGYYADKWFDKARAQYVDAQFIKNDWRL